MLFFSFLQMRFLFLRMGKVGTILFEDNYYFTKFQISYKLIDQLKLMIDCSNRDVQSFYSSQNQTFSMHDFSYIIV